MDKDEPQSSDQWAQTRARTKLSNRAVMRAKLKQREERDPLTPPTVPVHPPMLDSPLLNQGLSQGTLKFQLILFVYQY